MNPSYIKGVDAVYFDFRRTKEYKIVRDGAIFLDFFS